MSFTHIKKTQVKGLSFVENERIEAKIILFLDKMRFLSFKNKLTEYKTEKKPQKLI